MSELQEILNKAVYQKQKFSDVETYEISDRDIADVYELIERLAREVAGPE